MKFTSHSLAETYQFALKTISLAKDTQFILLEGDLGSGKTALVREIAKAMKLKDLVTSPTFNIMNIYDNKLVHIDAFRLQGQDLEEFEDFFSDKKVIIEWPEKLSNLKLEKYILIRSSIDENNNHIYEVLKHV